MEFGLFDVPGPAMAPRFVNTWALAHRRHGLGQVDGAALPSGRVVGEGRPADLSTGRVVDQRRRLAQGVHLGHLLAGDVVQGGRAVADIYQPRLDLRHTSVGFAVGMSEQRPILNADSDNSEQFITRPG